MARLYWKPSSSMLWGINFFYQMRMTQFMLWVGIPVTALGSIGLTGANRHAREHVRMIVDERVGKETFEKMSSHSQAQLRSQSTAEFLSARNTSELHLP
eukprot:NODE_5318_length_516_cov_400.702355_g3942_i0.p2 GENE.NODE_5318_length_516_cov_400.702355_g3942_i0~~NODE_5318_length_516_cov_400.702355_g3942_i0.p2  ORF type:complete len:99 (+),score=15.76 NODE_5318_length_516_cov_400.702355_g3942_i0:69-365(+)